MPRGRLVLTCVLGVAILLSISAPAKAATSANSFTFVSIDVPSAAKTMAIGINAAGDIVGAYFDAKNVQHGFLLSHGHFTSIDDPLGIATNARGIGPGGDIVGYYIVSPGTSLSNWKGFHYSHGTFSTILFTGHPGAIPQTISPSGTIYGCYHDSDFGASMFGAAWSRFGNTSVAAGGGELADPTASIPASMNTGASPDGTMVVGLYTDLTTMHNHGYLLQNGIFHPYDVPGSRFTAIWGMNPDGSFVGRYVDASGSHGFLQLSDGSAPIPIDFPGAKATIAFSVNAAGFVVGQYTDANGMIHGFLAVPPGED